MCMIEGADWDSSGFSVAVMRKARKPHTCGECNREIERGETYERQVGKYDGSLWTAETCRHCIAARKWLQEVCGGFVYHGVLEDLQEHIEEGYNPRWLNIAVSGMSKGWRDKSGKLWRPMKLPKNLSPLPTHA